MKITTRMRPKVAAGLIGFVILAPVLSAMSPAAGAAPLAFDPHLTRAPYLTDLVGLSATVNFATDRSGTSATVRYGPASGGACSLTNTSTASRVTVSVNSIFEYQWKARLTLPAAGGYCYRAYLGTTDLLATNASLQFSSQVPKGSTAPFSFAVLGDWGQVDTAGNNPDQANLMRQIAASGSRFAITVGDNAYPSGSQTNYGDLQQVGSNTSAVFGPPFWAGVGSSIPIFPAVGNHGLARSDAVHPQFANFPQDAAVSSSNGRYQKDVYCCPNGSASASYPSAWYAFDAGGSRFYVLDAAWADGNLGTGSVYGNDYLAHWTSNSPEYLWLKADLAAHPSGTKFAFFHYPLYSDQPSENSDTFLQGNASLEGLLAANGVNLAFSGHAHIYQRNAAATGAGRLGLPSYVTGGGGAKAQSTGACSSIDRYAIGWSFTNNRGTACGGAAAPTSPAQVYHYLKVTVSGSDVTVTPTASNGQTFDVQTYHFNTSTPPIDSTPPTTPGNFTATATSPFSVSLSWAAASDNVGVTGYDVIRDSTVLATVAPTTSYTDTTVTAGSSHTYAVRARDQAGNVSPSTPSILVTSPSSTTAIFTDGFESGDLSAWTTKGGLTVQGINVHGGGSAADGNTTNGATYAKKTLPSTYGNAYARIWYNLVAGPDQVNLLRLRDASGTSLGYLYLNTAGRLGYHNDATGTNTVSATAPTAGWHALELHLLVSGTTGAVEVWLDNTRIDDLSSTAANTGTSPVAQLQLGDVQTGRTYHVVFDDVAFGTNRQGP